MNRTQFKMLYYKFKKIVPLAAVKQGGTVYNLPIESNAAGYRFDTQKIFSTVLKKMQSANLLPTDINTDTLRDRIMTECGEFYLPISTRNVSEEPFGVFCEVGQQLRAALKYKGILSNGSFINIDPTDIFIATNPAPSLLDLRVYFYSDWVNFITQACGILCAAYERARTLTTAYGNIPTVNEQYTDETTITPDLTNVTQDNFNPITGTSPANKVTVTTTQKGKQTTTTKKAIGVSAREQAEIVRNLPNIFVEAINEIKQLLIDPRTVQDMFDWNLLGNSYVDGQEDI